LGLPLKNDGGFPRQRQQQQQQQQQQQHQQQKQKQQQQKQQQVPSDGGAKSTMAPGGQPPAPVAAVAPHTERALTTAESKQALQDILDALIAYGQDKVCAVSMSRLLF